MKRIAWSLAAAIALAGCGDTSTPAHPAVPTTASPPETANRPGAVGPNADNSATNKGDGKGALTPLDQGAGEEDVQETTAVRRAITDDKNLSTNAQNIKLITRNGKLTLRGTVSTSAEHDRVIQIVRDTIGPKQYDDQLNISLIK